ncbi:glycerate kinase [Pedococcus sp. 5OH_020]|uniref:glycerate kinase n=1 Tax=Pedococcus sp. 5OH_020 TaxID=2989814 RepID=UPI0022E9D8DE|nr:glycerate kinase [Pedococcus sp. 5OH_020]
MPRVVLAPDKFKGTLTAAEVASYLRAGLCSVCPDAEVVVIPVADGGDGTLTAAEAAGFVRVPVRTHGPTGMPHTSAFARRGSQAVVELADVSGLAQLPQGRPAPLTASSHGTGEVIAAALDAGADRIVVGIGGSACTDGGAGLLEALGARILTAQGRPVAPGGGGLADACHLDLTSLHPALAVAQVVVASDVDNPLTGARGAAAVYGPQKGAGPQDVERLDTALTRWADLMAEATGTDLRDHPGAGAAGGVGFALLAALGATLRAGAELVFELTGLDEALVNADLVVTGEGSLDRQTLHGKAPAAVARVAAALGVPVVAVAGRVTLDPEDLATLGLRTAYSLVQEAGSANLALAAPGPLLKTVGARIAREQLVDVS